MDTITDGGEQGLNVVNHGGTMAEDGSGGDVCWTLEGVAPKLQGSDT